MDDQVTEKHIMDQGIGTHLYKQYGYGLCKGKSTPKIAENKAQETLHFRYLKCWVK